MPQFNHRTAPSRRYSYAPALPAGALLAIAIVVAGYATSFYLLALVLCDISVSTAYAVSGAWVAMSNGVRGQSISSSSTEVLARSAKPLNGR
jgi:hypothetical protein